MQQLSDVSGSVFAIFPSASQSLKTEVSNTTGEATNAPPSQKTMYIIREKSCYFVCENFPAYLPNSLTHNHDSSIIQEEEYTESDGKIPSFLVNKKHIKSDTKLPTRQGHENTINAPYTTSINLSSKITIN